MSSQTALPDPADVMDPADEPTRTPTIWNSLLSDTAVWILAIDVILVIIFGFWSPEHTFWSVASLQVIALDAATALILAVGISLLLGAGEIDLSVGASLLLSSVYGGKVILNLSPDGVLFAALVGLVVCIAVGAGVGLVNGLIVTKLRVNSLIATLATLGICTGIANLATNGADLSGLPFQMQDNFGIRSFLDIPLPAFVALGVWAVSWFIFRTTRYGLRMLSLGSSRSAAERSGVRVNVQLDRRVHPRRLARRPRRLHRADALRHDEPRRPPDRRAGRDHRRRDRRHEPVRRPRLDRRRAHRHAARRDPAGRPRRGRPLALLPADRGRRRPDRRRLPRHPPHDRHPAVPPLSDPFDDEGPVRPRTRRGESNA